LREYEFGEMLFRLYRTCVTALLAAGLVAVAA